MKVKLERLAIPTSDLQLIRRVAARDQQAFAELYQRYELPLFNYLLRLVNEGPVAEDLLQEVFLALWNGAGGFHGQAKVSTWLFRVAHNQAVSWLRSHRPEVPEEWIADLAGENDNPEALAFQTLRNDQIRSALDGLSTEHRAVIELAFYYDMPYAEIAEVIGCPVGTVKSRMSYARRYLASVLHSLAGEDRQQNT